MGQAGGRGRREVVTLSLVFILSYVSPGARKNPKHVPIGPHKCRQAAEGYLVSPRSERAVALTSWGSRPSLPNEYNVFILGTSLVMSVKPSVLGSLASSLRRLESQPREQPPWQPR